MNMMMLEAQMNMTMLGVHWKIRTETQLGIVVCFVFVSFLVYGSKDRHDMLLEHAF
jgi:hypothetical protein